MTIAFHVLAHKNPPQLRLVVGELVSGASVILLHVDKKSPKAVHDEAARLAVEFEKVRVQKSRVVTWGGYSTVRVEVLGIRRLLRDKNWTHYINLSGQDFPLVAPDILADYLAQRPEESWLLRLNPAEAWGDHRRRVDPIWRERDGALRRSSRAFRREWLLGRRSWIGGSQWMVLSREHCRLAVSPVRTLGCRLFFRWSLLSDESYFPTVLGDCGHGKMWNTNRRFLRWDVAHAAELSRADAAAAVESGAWFARKLAPSDAADGDPVVMDLLANLKRRAPPSPLSGPASTE